MDTRLFVLLNYARCRKLGINNLERRPGVNHFNEARIFFYLFTEKMDETTVTARFGFSISWLSFGGGLHW